jgi:hypothetical protein
MSVCLFTYLHICVCICIYASTHLLIYSATHLLAIRTVQQHRRPISSLHNQIYMTYSQTPSVSVCLCLCVSVSLCLYLLTSSSSAQVHTQTHTHTQRYTHRDSYIRISVSLCSAPPYISYISVSAPSSSTVETSALFTTRSIWSNAKLCVPVSLCLCVSASASASTPPPPTPTYPHRNHLVAQ